MEDRIRTINSNCLEQKYPQIKSVPYNNFRNVCRVKQGTCSLRLVRFLVAPSTVVDVSGKPLWSDHKDNLAANLNSLRREKYAIAQPSGIVPSMMQRLPQVKDHYPFPQSDIMSVFLVGSPSIRPRTLG